MPRNKIHITIYISIALGFVLLLASILLSYQSLQNSSTLLKNLERSQIELLYRTNELDHEIKQSHVNVMQSLVVDKNIDMFDQKTITQQIQQKIQTIQNNLETSSLDAANFQEILNTIKKRSVGFSYVTTSLKEAVKSHDEQDIQDALVSFNLITQKFSYDVEQLLNILQSSVKEQIALLQDSNNKNIRIIIFSFAITLILILGALLKFNTLTRQILAELHLRKKAQQELLGAQDKLQNYNKTLQNEITKKTQELQTKIFTNHLTHLPNRNKILDDNMKKKFDKMALLNIDKFQSFNDIYGEEMGNVALQKTAKWLEEYLQNQNYLLYHLGGDEFVVVSLDTDEEEREFISYIKLLLRKYKSTPFQYDNIEHQFIMSSGITFTNKYKMLAFADMALKEAKQNNMPLSVFQDETDMQRSHKEDLEIQRQLKYAFEHNTLVSHFQPIVPIQDATKPTKFESLIRLIDENGNTLAPYKFIPVAKSIREYYKITRAVIHNTLATVQKYQIPSSINLSMTDITNERTMHYFFDTLEDFAYNELLTVELLETENFENYENVRKFCLKARTYGVKIALDDFGSGYSNFTHVLNLPIDYIKIDASLIATIDKDINLQVMVETIVTLAKKLEVETVAEFVSSADILHMVHSLGVDYAQGFHLGKPLAIEEHISLS